MRGAELTACTPLLYFMMKERGPYRQPWHERHLNILLLAPALIIIILITVYPISNIFRLSFYRYNPLREINYPVGIAHYARFLGDRFFVQGLKNTFLFSITATVAEILLGLGLALLFNVQFRGRKLLLPVAIFPMMLSTMVVCAIWSSMYHYDYGIFNHLLEMIGLGRVKWLIDPDLALWSVVLVDIWQWTPMAFLILLAGLQSIPKELYEAGRVDGATGIYLFQRITLPLLRNHILLALLLRSIDTFKIFDKVYALTGGGPGSATETISFYIYREGFRYFNMGKASAAAVVMFVAVAGVTAFYIHQVLKESSA